MLSAFAARNDTPLRHDRRMPRQRLQVPHVRSFDQAAPPALAEADVVELWWCPVCNGAAHRTNRPGRPKIYCSNACRQVAYRWRRDNHARTVAPPGHPAAGAFVAFGRWHALRTSRDFVSRHSDRRRREPTVCGVLAKPSRLLRGRTHTNFVAHGRSACRSCATLISLPVDARASIETGWPEGSLGIRPSPHYRSLGDEPNARIGRPPP
jgi:hypothetical protein